MDRRIVAISGIAVFVASCAVAPPQSQPSAKARSMKAEEVSLIDGYRSWHKVNASPYSIDAVASGLCTDPRSEVRRFANVDPHTRHFITVFVNEVGKEALLKIHHKQRLFPVGTIIVKEKLVGEFEGKTINWGRKWTEQDSRAFHSATVPSGAKPVLMTVMVKRDKGFNPKCFDWEFLTYEPGRAAPLSQGKLESCQSCHTMRPESEGVFASYVPWPSAGNN